MSHDNRATTQEKPAESLARRNATVMVFVGVWMALGWWLRLEPNRYLLLGVPLTLLFQMLVRRESLRTLWVRDAPLVRCDARWLIITVLLAALPLYELCTEGRDWVTVGWMLCAISGAPAAAYALQNWNHRSQRAVRSVVPVLLFVSLLMVLATILGKGSSSVSHNLKPATITFVQSFLLYFPVGFWLEEVSFRGALDAHVYRPEDKRAYGSALWLSALWGIWHLPIVPTQGALLPVIVQLAFLHMLVGVPLTMSWRISGNLAVPAAAHALLDAVRNAAQTVSS